MHKDILGESVMKAEYSKKESRIRIFFKEQIDIIAVVFFLVLFFLFCGYCFTAGIISGNSMAPTYKSGDVIYIKRLYYSPDYGDVIVIKANDRYIYKRIIAMEGDVVDFNSFDGYVYVNGEKLDEPYAIGKTFAYDDNVQSPLVVTEGHVFVLGDNREISEDSRSSKYGLISKECIVGKVCRRLFNIEWVFSNN